MRARTHTDTTASLGRGALEDCSAKPNKSMQREPAGRFHPQMPSRLQPPTRYQGDLACSFLLYRRTHIRRGSVLGQCRTCLDLREHREKEKRRGRLHPDLRVGGSFSWGRFFCFSRNMPRAGILIGKALQAGPNTRFALVGSKLN